MSQHCRFPYPIGFCSGPRVAAILRALHLDSICISRKNAIQVPFILSHYRGKAEETALLDSGATENFVDHTTIVRLRLGTKKLERPRAVFNVDGTLNKHGTITYACNLMIIRGRKKERQQFYVTNLGKDRFIFGYPWCRVFAPEIDWQNTQLKGPKVFAETLLYGRYQRIKHFVQEKQKE